MTFKSKLPWPESKINTRTRYGTPQGAATERRMVNRVGGSETIRKDYRTNPDGSVTMAHTRGPGTQPEIITPPVERKEATEKGRTFVFTLIDGKSATIANRHLQSSAFDIVKRKVAVGAARYFVAATKIASLIATTWDDVWRLDGTKLSTNGKTPKLTKAVSSPVNDKSMLPFVLLKDGKYADNAPVFAGYSSTSGRGAAVSLATGRTVVSIPYADLYERRCAAGVSASEDTFSFYGGQLILNAQYGSPKQVLSLWANIQCANTPPYLRLSAQGETAWTLGAATGVDAVAASVDEDFSLSNTNFITGYFEFDTSVVRGTGDSIAAYSVNFTFNPNKRFPHNRKQISGTQHRSFASVSDSQTLTAYVGSGFDMTSSAEMGGSCVAISGAGIEDQYSVQPFYGPEGASRTYVYYFTLPSMASLVSQEPWAEFVFLNPVISEASGYKPRTFTGSITQNDSSFTTSSQLSVSGLKDVYSTDTSVDYHLTHGIGTYATDVVASTLYADSYGAMSNDPDEVAVGDYLVDVLTSMRWYGGAGDAIASTEYRNTVVSNLTIDHVANTVDYIYVDRMEEVTLALEATLTATESTVNGATSYVRNLILRYVLSVRGVEYSVVVFDGGSFTPPCIRLTNIFPSNRDSRGESTNPLGAYHSGYVGTPIFSPPFMEQGNCPYIAYTTKHEEENGANPEFYMDFSLLPRQHTDIPNTDDADLYTGTTQFCPHQFLLVYRKYLGGEDPTTFMLTRNQTLWGQLFPRATRFQFANGVIGPWQSALGDPFLSNPPVEISRT